MVCGCDVWKPRQQIDEWKPQSVTVLLYLAWNRIGSLQLIALFYPKIYILFFKCNTKPRLSSPLAVIMCQGKPEPSSLFLSKIRILPVVISSFICCVCVNRLHLVTEMIVLTVKIGEQGKCFLLSFFPLILHDIEYICPQQCWAKYLFSFSTPF